jgi:hypothetical protein
LGRAFGSTWELSAASEGEVQQQLNANAGVTTTPSIDNNDSRTQILLRRSILIMIYQALYPYRV